MRTRWIITGIALVVWIALSGLSPAAGPRAGLWRQAPCTNGIASLSCPDSALHQPSGYVLESPQGAIQTDSETHQPSNFVLPSPAGAVSLDSMRPDG